MTEHKCGCLDPHLCPCKKAASEKAIMEDLDRRSVHMGDTFRYWWLNGGKSSVQASMFPKKGAGRSWKENAGKEFLEWWDNGGEHLTQHELGLEELMEAAFYGGIASTNLLPPCPFCGFKPSLGDADCLYPVNPSKDVWSLNCYVTGGGCGASVLGDSREDCIEKWGKRK